MARSESANRCAFFARTAVMLNGIGDNAPNLKSVIGCDEYGVERLIRRYQPHPVTLELDAFEGKVAINTAY